MLDKQGFNAWAQAYDKQVRESDQHKTYPFDGYSNVLYTLYKHATKTNPKTLLDIGIGTGVLTKRFYDEGLTIYGMDFSDAMIEKAKRRMFNAKLYLHDMKDGLPNELKNKTYDIIVSSYAFHHLSDDEKIDLINTLLPTLSEHGKLLIGDIGFETEDDLIRVKNTHKDLWDDTEHYLVYETIKDKLPPSTYTQISTCAGILIIPKN